MSNFVIITDTSTYAHLQYRIKAFIRFQEHVIVISPILRDTATEPSPRPVPHYSTGNSIKRRETEKKREREKSIILFNKNSR